MVDNCEFRRFRSQFCALRFSHMYNSITILSRSSACCRIVESVKTYPTRSNIANFDDLGLNIAHKCYRTCKIPFPHFRDDPTSAGSSNRLQRTRPGRIFRICILDICILVDIGCVNRQKHICKRSLQRASSQTKWTTLANSCTNMTYETVDTRQKFA